MKPPIAPVRESPSTLTYLELRRAVGFIALGLPFAVALPRLITRHALEGSISAYYYTGSRNLFVGGLCSIAMFLLCCRGFDRKDLIAGVSAAIFALGVAFFPTRPENPTPRQETAALIHVASAILLFSTLSVFCLWLFRMTAADVRITREKVQRNSVYTTCGIVILGSMAAIGLCWLLHVNSIFGIGPWLIFETTALEAFGVAWLTKGEFILKDDSTRR